MPGVPRPGAKIMLDFAGTAGSKTGKLLPTGNVKDKMMVEGLGGVTVSMVDAGSPMVFIAAKDLGLTGKETAKEVDANKELLEKLEKIRAMAAERMGMVKNWKDAVTGMRSVPMPAFVAPPESYVCALNNETIPGDSIDFLSRVMFMQIMHKTYAGTASVCTGAAAKIPGTVVNDVMRKGKKDDMVRIGHPGGSLSIETVVEKEGNEFVLKRAAVGGRRGGCWKGTCSCRENT
jgi:2-methylaconitate cis-trans-isomerase PrpF